MTKRMSDHDADATASARSWVAEVVILPKEGVNDPQGEAIRGGLASLGYHMAERVRFGKFIQLWVRADDAEAARTTVASMCDQLLANPVIESYEVIISEMTPTAPMLAQEEE